MQRVLLPSMKWMPWGIEAAGRVCSCQPLGAIPCLTVSSCHCYNLNDIGSGEGDRRGSTVTFALQKVVGEHWGNRRGAKCHSPKWGPGWSLTQYDFCYGSAPQSYALMCWSHQAKLLPCCMQRGLKSISGKWKFSFFTYLMLIYIPGLCLTEINW